jgi:hypothetical protein
MMWGHLHETGITWALMNKIPVYGTQFWKHWLAGMRLNYICVQFHNWQCVHVHVEYVLSTMIYSISYGKEGTSLSGSDVDRYAIFTKLRHSVFNILPVFIDSGKFKYTCREIFFRKVAYTRYDVPWFVEQTDYILNGNDICVMYNNLICIILDRHTSYNINDLKVPSSVTNIWSYI